MTSYGSGAGSDAFSFKVTDEIEKIQSYTYSTDYYLKRKEMIDYGTYARYKGVIR
jgi:hydroxymethylglutaryl-CoA synthase